MTNSKHIAQIVTTAKAAGFESCNPTLVSAVLAGTAMRATTGAGVTDELWTLITRAAKTCTCPSDCNCHHPYRTNFCGCREH